MLIFVNFTQNWICRILAISSGNRSKTMVKNWIATIIASEFEFCAHSFFRTNSPEPKMLKYMVFSGIGGGEGGKFTGVNTLNSGPFENGSGPRRTLCSVEIGPDLPEGASVHPV
jgi:hypothetical protein